MNRLSGARSERQPPPRHVCMPHRHGQPARENSAAVRKRIEEHKFVDEEGEEYEGSAFGGFSTTSGGRRSSCRIATRNCGLPQWRFRRFSREWLPMSLGTPSHRCMCKWYLDPSS